MDLNRGRLTLHLALGALLTFPIAAHATDEPPSPEATPAAAESSLTAEFPWTLQRPGALPLGFDGDTLLAPYNLIFKYHRVPEPHHPAFLFEANANFPRYSAIPAWGVTPGVAFNGGSFILEALLDIQDQKTVRKTPFSGSQFDTWIVSLIARGRICPATVQWLTLGLDGRYASFSKTSLAQLEGLETTIDHQGSVIISPWVGMELPFEFRLRARLDIDLLGSTAIASKEFALGIGSQTVERLGLSLGHRLGPLGIDAQYYWVTGFRDATELSYQAPFYHRDYLLSPQTLTLGVSWYF